MELVVKRFDELTTRELYDLLKARETVFIVEQNCPYQDIDDRDQSSYHVFYRENDKIQACVRVIPINPGCESVSIGRVLTIARGTGLGRKIMLEGIRIAKERLNADTIYIEAQQYAQGFYEGLGFQRISDEFMEDGIPHVKMLLTI